MGINQGYEETYCKVSSSHRAERQSMLTDIDDIIYSQIAASSCGISLPTLRDADIPYPNYLRCLALQFMIENHERGVRNGQPVVYRTWRHVIHPPASEHSD
jgi:hypothetical protein